MSTEICPIDINLLNVLSNIKTSNACQLSRKSTKRRLIDVNFRACFTCQQKIYNQIDINLLYVLLTINRKTSRIDVNSSGILDVN